MKRSCTALLAIASLINKFTQITNYLNLERACEMTQKREIARRPDLSLPRRHRVRLEWPITSQMSSLPCKQTSCSKPIAYISGIYMPITSPIKAFSKMKYVRLLLPLALVSLVSGCNEKPLLSDGYGNFEAREVMVAPELTGKLLQLNLEEGQLLEAGQAIGLIDTLPLHLRRLQIQSAITAIEQKTQDATPQIAVLEAQAQHLDREIQRTSVLLQNQAAASNQLDDLNAQLEIVQRQIRAAKSQENTTNRGIRSEIAPLKAQIHLVEDQIDRCYLKNPVTGTVLAKLAEATEIAVAGKPLYKIADLRQMTLRAYVSGEQLPKIKIGQMVKVLIDESKDSDRALNGRITWIADQAEFTPRTVQTKAERVNLVYAIKIHVVNDGSLKIGMPGEVIFSSVR